MKRIGVAVVLLIISIALCIYEQYTVEETYKEATALIDAALAEAEQGDYNKTAEALNELGEYWNRKYKSLKVMIDHGSIDEVSVIINSFDDIADDADSDTVKENLITAKNQIKSIRDNQRITFGNIF